MKNNLLTRILLVAIPWALLSGMLLSAYLPIFRGKEYLLQVAPRDPRNFFRGNYVDLRYAFTSLDRKGMQTDLDPVRTYHFGDLLFLDLEEKDGVLKPVGLYEAREKAVHIPLKVQPRWPITKDVRMFELVAGVESFFAPTGDAQSWEKALRNGKVYAKVAIDTNGNARLLKLSAQDAAL